MLSELPPIPEEVKALLNVTRAYPDGIGYAVRDIVRDCETTEPVLVVAIDGDRDVRLVMSVEQFRSGQPLPDGLDAVKRAVQAVAVDDDIFRHFKGGTYRICCMACDVRTMSVAVVYRSLSAPGCGWARPYSSGPSPWSGTVAVDGQQVERFRRLGPPKDPYEEAVP